MKATLKILALAALLLFLGCNDRVDEVDSGGVLLEVEFEETIFRVGVNTTTLVQIPTTNITSIIARPAGTGSQLMDVQLDTVEVTFTRLDTGTRVPPPFYFNVISTVPAGGTLTYDNMPIMSFDQLNRPPLSDLKFENGGYDRETGAAVVKLLATVRVYGKTVSGKNVSSTPRSQNFEFVP